MVAWLRRPHSFAHLKETRRVLPASFPSPDSSIPLARCHHGCIIPKLQLCSLRWLESKLSSGTN